MAPVAPVVAPVAPVAPAANEDNIPVAKIATNFTEQPVPPAPAAVEQQPVPAPAPTPAPMPAPSPAPAPVTAAPDDANIPVAPIAKVQDYNTPTNAAPVNPPAPKPDGGSFP